MLDGVMKPATKTIAQLLESEPHFSSFRKRNFIFTQRQLWLNG
jgi:hypothetical protein